MRTQNQYEALREYYEISPEGEVMSKKTGRYIKPQVNSCGYIMYRLVFPYPLAFSCHALVAYFYIGPRPKGFDIDHLDGNKGNNHFSNLRYLSHSENVRKDYKENRRVAYWKGKTKPSPALETRLKMADAKKKPVRVDGVVYDSIGDCAESLGWYREKVYRSIKKGEYKGMKFELL